MKRKRRLRLQRRIAVHEAGHTAIARVLGMRVFHVALFPVNLNSKNPGAWIERAEALAPADDVIARIRGIEIDAKIAMAGPLAEELYRPPSRKSALNWSSDAEQTKPRLMEIVQLRANPHLTWKPNSEFSASPTEQEEYKRLVKQFTLEVAALLDQHWPKVKRIATALLVRKVLYEDDIDALIQSESLLSSARL
jgi:ATP-dependent Zn protease